MKIAIVGSGAIGLYYGARLQRIGEQVHFLMRGDLQTAQQSGVRVLTPEEDFTLHPVKAHDSTQDIGICDLVIVALKATSNTLLGELLPPLIGEGTSILTLQNGLGSDRSLAELFPENKVCSGLCFVCLNRIAPAVVQNFMLGSVSIGPYGETPLAEAEKLTSLFTSAGVKTRCEKDLQLVQWKKLVWNVPFNGLTIAAGGVTTDAIVNSPELLAEARGLMEEVIAGAAAIGMTIDRSFIDRQIQQTIPMQAYKPSSVIDFLEGRRVEVEAIWGEPLRQAKAADASMPKLEMLYALLKQLCSK